MKNNHKLKPISALNLQGFLCVLAGALRPSYTRFDVFCIFQKSFVQEKILHFKISIFQSKIFILRARQATYNQLTTKEGETMNLIQSIMKLFGRRETKRQGKTDYKSIRLNYNAEQARILNEINKQTGKTDFRAYRNRMTWIGNKEGKL